MNKDNNSRDSIDLNAKLNDFYNKVNSFNSKENCVNMDIPFEKCITLFDTANSKILKERLKENKLKEEILMNVEKTPLALRSNYTNQFFDIIKKMNKSNIFQELPKLPFGKQLSDTDFIALLKESVSYANYKFETQKIENIKSRLINDYSAALTNLFNRGQTVKDILENAIITILTTDVESEQEDNFKLLTVENSTATPIVCMNFGDIKEYDLDIKELQNIYCSYIYIKKYQQALKLFFDKIPSESKIRKYICNHLENHYIYFCDLPQNILAFTIHSGNIYLKGGYLYEYYNEKKENHLLIREKIILNIGHEIMHILMREIDKNMKCNFVIKSNPNNSKIKNEYIEFNNKFTDEIHLFDVNESGALFDYKFFNKYYFSDLYLNEANFFYDIKNINSLKKYNKQLEDIIKDEKNKNIIPIQVNKFKKLKDEFPRRCIRSRIIGIKIKTKNKLNKKESDSEESEISEESD